LESGGASAFIERPPGVEGFLPISSLMSLYYFLLTGVIHPYHPAGLFILGGIILMSLVVGKSFCSWLCPVGLLSESLADLTERLFGRTLKPPRWLDYPLRSLKYLLLAFFVYAIFFAMSAVALRVFLDSPYNLMADVKMYYFFADITRFSLIVIGALILLSLAVRGFWCRYLCPYGALLGVLGLMSPAKVRRNPSTCIDCTLCARHCPSRITVDRVTTVVSDECTSCLNCVDICPVENTLDVTFGNRKRRIQPRWVAAAAVAIFLVVTGAAMISGQWQNPVSMDRYLEHMDNVESMGHPTSSSELSDLDKAPSRPDGR
jgi:polyferredoxin